MDKVKKLCELIVDSPIFQHGITVVIVFNAMVLGLDTYEVLSANFGVVFFLVNDVVLGIFVAEAVVKIIAARPGPSAYFKNSWDLFDFTVVAICLIPASGNIALVARVLRVLRLLSVIPGLRILVQVLIRSLPSMFNVVLLTVIIFYVYGVLGHYLFAEVDPTHWQTLGTALLSLFEIITLADFTDIMATAMAAHSWAWIYFVSLVLVGTFVVLNLIVAIVISKHEEAIKSENAEQANLTGHDELLRELQATNLALETLSKRIDQLDSKTVTTR